MKNNGKRILSVTIRKMIDADSDTSYLGEYSNRAETEYAIDRAHSEDCPFTDRTRDDYSYQHELDENGDVCTLCDMAAKETLSNPCSEYVWEDDCTCTRRLDKREYRYFNACVKNYKGIDPATIREYVRKDYERMEALQQGNWQYFGIRAEAELQLTSNTVQHISSPGTGGIESDGDKEYFAEVAKEELSSLREELRSLGFSARAISAAFKDVQEKDE